MDTSTSYTLPQPPPEIPAEFVRPPSSIKVFGVIHVILAAYGLITGVFGIVSTLFLKSFVEFIPGMKGQQAGIELEKTTALMKELQPYSLTHAAFALVLAVLLLLAGLGLLRNQEKGRKWSVRYAWTSIVFKVIYLIVNLVVILPLTKAMAMSELHTIPDNFSGTMELVMTITTVFSVVITFVYPIVTLVILNGKQVRSYLTGR